MRCAVSEWQGILPNENCTRLQGLFAAQCLFYSLSMEHDHAGRSVSGIWIGLLAYKIVQFQEMSQFSKLKKAYLCNNPLWTNCANILLRMLTQDLCVPYCMQSPRWSFRRLKNMSVNVLDARSSVTFAAETFHCLHSVMTVNCCVSRVPSAISCALQGFQQFPCACMRLSRSVVAA